MLMLFFVIFFFIVAFNNVFPVVVVAVAHIVAVDHVLLFGKTA